jgi:hypothetical protein
MVVMCHHLSVTALVVPWPLRSPAGVPEHVGAGFEQFLHSYTGIIRGRRRSHVARGATVSVAPSAERQQPPVAANPPHRVSRLGLRWRLIRLVGVAASEEDNHTIPLRSGPLAGLP